MTGPLDTPEDSEQRRTEFADCIWYELTIAKTGLIHQLLLTVSFGLQTFPVFGGSVEFGLRKAQLRIKCSGASIPLNSRWPNRRFFQESVVNHIQDLSTLSKQNYGTKAQAVMEIGNISGEVSISDEQGGEQQAASRLEYTQISTNLIVSGSPANPVWRFNTLLGQIFLEGEILDETLGVVEINESDRIGSVRGQFGTEKRHITMVDSEGFIAGLATGTKSVILHALIRKQIFNKLKDELTPVHMSMDIHSDE